MQNFNCDVKCTVENCKHNDCKCGCLLNKIEITEGMTENAHYCKNYECECGCKGKN